MMNFRKWITRFVSSFDMLVSTLYKLTGWQRALFLSTPLPASPVSHLHEIPAMNSRKITSIICPVATVTLWTVCCISLLNKLDTWSRLVYPGAGRMSIPSRSEQLISSRSCFCWINMPILRWDSKHEKCMSNLKMTLSCTKHYNCPTFQSTFSLQYLER